MRVDRMDLDDLMGRLAPIVDDEDVMMDLIMECVFADDDKINRVGNALNVFLNLKQFTPYEAAALGGTILISSCVERAKIKGVESTKIFGENLVQTISSALTEVLGEIEEGKFDESCKDGNKSCKCE